MTSRSLCVVLVISALLGAAVANLGVDTSSYVSTDSYSCMINNGLVFAVARVFTEGGNCDSDGLASINNARAAGVQYVDGYIYPDTSMDPGQQIDAMLGCLSSNNVNFGMIWLDVEPDSEWSGDAQTNINFINALSAELDNRGIKHGIYTNANGWNQITGGWGGLGNLPLWWAFWDNDPSFDNWSPFGGWSSPAMKQYDGDTTLCGISVDLNFW